MKTMLHISTIAGSTLILGLILLFSVSDYAVARQDKPQQKAWLGVAIQNVTESVAKKNNLTKEQGAYVNDVPDESPADAAGIKKGDVILEFNHDQIEDADALVSAVEKSKVGDKVDVAVVRKGEKKNFQVVLGKTPKTRTMAFSIRRPENLVWMFGNHTMQGMQLMELNEQLSEYFGVANGTGILVEKVEKGSAAEKAGVKAGDVLQKIGKRNIDDMEDVRKALAKADDGDKVPVEVLRKGSSKSLTLEVEEDESTPSFNYFRKNSPDAEVFRTPHFEGNFFNDPSEYGRQFQIELNDIRPQMDKLNEHIREMTRGLREQRSNIEKSMRAIRIRTV